MFQLSRRRFSMAALASSLTSGPAWAADFERALGSARGQTVYFNAWGGSEPINAYIDWAVHEVHERFGIDLVHVKLADTAEAVARVLAEKSAGRAQGGSVDLIWINGENFKAMKEEGLLFGPFAQDLPNFRLVDTIGNPATLVDFAVPTEGYESPWGLAQFVLIHDTARLPEPPRTISDLFAWADGTPGRMTWPAPPDFIGSTFLKHVLYETVDDEGSLRLPVERSAFDVASAPMWDALEEVRPHLWRSGRSFPASGPALHQLFEDSEVDFSMAFNPAEASSLIAQGRFPNTARSFILDGGTIANAHFIAIPFNASAKEAALVIADFLLSPDAQAKKQDPAGWGDFTVLDLAALSPEDRARFDALERGVATPDPEALFPTRLEPDASWMTLIEEGWRRRYGS